MTRHITQLRSSKLFSYILSSYIIARRAFVWDPCKFRCPYVRMAYGVRSPSGYFGSFMLVDRHRRQVFWTHMFKQNLKRRKIGQKKTVFKQERNDRPKSVFEKSLKNFPQAMYARKYRIVFCWIHIAVFFIVILKSLKKDKYRAKHLINFK